MPPAEPRTSPSAVEPPSPPAEHPALAMLAVRGSRGWIGGMGTRPGARRHGLGKAAMIAALESAWSRGLVRVELEVLVENLQAIALYERLGFVDQRRLEVWERPASLAPPAPA